MVHIADHDIKVICNYWGKIDCKQVGGEALARLFIAYPWVQRYFSTFGNLGSADAICHNAKVLHHGEKVVLAIGEAFKHHDNLKAHFAKLSTKHSEQLHVDPANFKLFGNVLIIVLAEHFKQEFTPEVQDSFTKGISAVVEALSSCYH